MTCREFLDRYSDYDDSLLTTGELSEFRAHIGGCAACARYDRVLRKGRMLARQLPRPEPDGEFQLRLRQRLLRAPTRPRRRGLLLPPFAAAAMAVVTILLVSTSALALLERLTPAEAADPALVVPVALEGRSVVLPPEESPTPRAWAAERVDRRLAASYSPLVTGPPAYRVARRYPLGPTSPLRRTLD